MIERTATIASPVGLHARPAKVFAESVLAAGFPVTLTKGDKSVNAGSILGLLGLGAAFGDTVTLTTSEESNANELTALAELLSTNLDES